MPDGGSGEASWRGPGLLSGYWNDSELILEVSPWRRSSPRKSGWRLPKRDAHPHGYGYTAEFPRESYQRDVVLNLIGEGTNGVLRQGFARESFMNTRRAEIFNESRPGYHRSLLRWQPLSFRIQF